MASIVSVEAKEFTRACGDKVILKAREDLTEASNDGSMIKLITSNEVTNIPDNVGVCEIVSVGELVHNVKPGDIVFIDFFDVDQGYILACETLFLAPCHAFRAHFNPKTGDILPMPGYVVTRRSPSRMTIAMNGTDRFEVPRSILTSGFVGDRTTSGQPVGHIVYEEVVSIGKMIPTCKEPGNVASSKAEAEWLFSVNNGRQRSPRERYLLGALYAALGKEIPDPIIKEGDLVGFCTDFACPIRVKGEFCHIVAYDRVGLSIDDSGILEQMKKNREQPAAE